MKIRRTGRIITKGEWFKFKIVILSKSIILKVVLLKEFWQSLNLVPQKLFRVIFAKCVMKISQAGFAWIASQSHIVIPVILIFIREEFWQPTQSLSSQMTLLLYSFVLLTTRPNNLIAWLALFIYAQNVLVTTSRTINWYQSLHNHLLLMSSN